MVGMLPEQQAILILNLKPFNYKWEVIMRTIIAGSRSCKNFNIVRDVINNCEIIPTVIISGGARGVDKFGEMYAKSRGIELEVYPAQWDTYGKSAGYRRNEQMAELADALIAIWDGHSKGTRHMINTAYFKRLKVYVYKLAIAEYIK